ncbi:unnamed protein product [Coregonus sp. 'balchen']|nr:unnamed protein product [Coregonus sp. 'balchen']
MAEKEAEGIIATDPSDNDDRKCVIIRKLLKFNPKEVPIHYVSVCVCLLGVGAMVGADLLAGRDLGSTSDVLLGDGLVLLSASLYAVSNVVCMPIVVKKTSATAVNLSLLTADLLSLFCGLFLFQYTFSGLYMVCLVVILVGFVSFNAVATTPDPADPIALSMGWEEGSYENPDDIIKEEVVVAVLEEKEDQEEEEGERPWVSWNQRTQNEEVPAGGQSTKM